MRPTHSPTAVFANPKHPEREMSRVAYTYSSLLYFIAFAAASFPPVVAEQEDFMKAVRKIAENKKLEGKLDYSKV